MATYVYDDFRVSFTPRSDELFDVLARGADGNTASGTFTMPLSAADLERAVLDVATRAATRTTRDLRGVGPARLDAQTLGSKLAEALLRDGIGAAYDRARQQAAADGHGLRLSLDLGAAPALLSVPWEFLYRPPRFLASQRRSPIVRVLGTPELGEPPVIEGAVRVLGVIASPNDLAPLDVAAERQRVDRAVEAVRATGRIELDWLEAATPGSLRRALRDENYHVVHYVGHSDFTDDGNGVLFLEQADGSSLPVDETLFANLLSDQDSLRLVVLNSCEGARTTLTDPYAGVATTLVRLGVPAVVAMQFEISDAAAIVFAEELYANLIGRQDPLDAAIGEARKAIYAEVDVAEWATPVLFLGDPDVQLFRFAVEAAPLPPPDPPGEPELPVVAPTPPIVADAPPAPAATPRRPVIISVSAVVLLAVLGVVLWLLLRDRSAPEGDIAATTTAATTPTTVSAAEGFPSVPVGSDGPVVEVIQRLLTHREIPVEPNGFFDEATEDAVIAFEESVGIPPDGLVGRVTWQQLVVPLRRGQEGEAVRALQLLLVENGIDAQVDGRYTLDIQDRVVEFQRAAGLGVDGIADVDTWRVLLARAA
ncbi:MAG: CHAT domain-containing protein [Ilumatobacteraceae bacterium]